jgi:hypothetical protein
MVSVSELVADLVGMMCAYPFLVISTCIRAGSIRTLRAICAAPWTIFKKNGLTALWWGLVPYMLSRLVVTFVWASVEQQMDRVESQLFPTGVSISLIHECIASNLVSVLYICAKDGSNQSCLGPIQFFFFLRRSGHNVLHQGSTHLVPGLYQVSTKDGFSERSNDTPRL